MNKVRVGDARELIKKMPEYAYIISDPPYNQGYHYATYGDDLETKEYIALLKAVFGGRRAVIIHYPEETINLLGGGGSRRVPTGRIVGLQLEHDETIEARDLVELQARFQEDSSAV